MYVYMMNVLAFMFYYTIEPYQIYYAVLNYLVWVFVPLVIIYKAELTFYAIVIKLSIAVGFFLIICLICMSLLYVFKLQTKLRDLNVENIKLLDGMHEGLLILSKSNKNVMFCNRPS